jgi:hypothetical protein
LISGRTNHSLSYGFSLSRYLDDLGGTNTSHNATWASDIMPTARTHLVMGALGSIFTYSSLTLFDPATASVTSSPINTTSHVLNLALTETFTSEPSGSRRYTQGLTVGYTRALDEVTTLPETVQLAVLGRGDHIQGRYTYSLTATVSQYFRISEVPADQVNAFGIGQVMSGTVLAGWRREFSVSTAVEVQAGFLFLYSFGLHSLAVGPAGTGTLTYRRIPWYATLMISQAPALNPYLGNSVIADSVAARLSVPLNARETLLLSGLAGYVYARDINPNGRFVNAHRLYDTISLGAYATYRFERVPVGISLEYTVLDQRGSSLHDGIVAPNTLRRYVGISVGGAFTTARDRSAVPTR